MTSCTVSNDYSLSSSAPHEIFHVNDNLVSCQYNTSYKIHVKVAPTSSTKSRVETQIKLCLSLVHSNGIHAPYWSYIRIPSSFIAKQKPHSRHLLLDGSTAAMVSDESKVLDLEARVICESDPDKEVYMCAGCVRRERKRAERRKNTKPTSYRLNAGRVDKEFEHERKRILLLNCEPLVAFHTLTADLLVRITCYCRHQNERLGYRIRFSLKNYHGQTVASGESPLLMITDDHKKPHTPASCNMPSENAALQPLDSMIVHHANGQFHFPPEDCHTNNPTINYVVPEVGPLTGGIEVTLLGENLNQDLMVMFGNHPAILVSSDEYSLVCLLPPAQEQGACALFFRNKPVGHTYFTYH
ncbi:uncharacterized protein B0P05DRAFT_546484, partial [Gilbertella persicaria]|uniref:uncharacterized protein n=1 Tax=Gilbertella persicaria TaxID=101096 RepID=UPI002220E6DE